MYRLRACAKLRFDLYSLRSATKNQQVFFTAFERSIWTMKNLCFVYGSDWTAYVRTRALSERYRYSGPCYAELRMVIIVQAQIPGKRVPGITSQRWAVRNGRARSPFCTLSYPTGTPTQILSSPSNKRYRDIATCTKLHFDLSSLNKHKSWQALFCYSIWPVY